MYGFSGSEVELTCSCDRRFDLWAAAASVSAAVSKSVQQRAEEIVQSVQNTDWQSELQVFGKEASKAVQEDAQTLKNKTTEVVEHLPETVRIPYRHCLNESCGSYDHCMAVSAQCASLCTMQASALPAAVVASLPRVSESGAAMEHALENVGDTLVQLGQSFFAGTKGLLDQVYPAVRSFDTCGTSVFIFHIHMCGSKAAGLSLCRYETELRRRLPRLLRRINAAAGLGKLQHLSPEPPQKARPQFKQSTTDLRQR